MKREWSEWNVNEMWMKREWNVNEMWMKCEWNVNEMWMKREWNVNEMWMMCDMTHQRMCDMTRWRNEKNTLSHLSINIHLNESCHTYVDSSCPTSERVMSHMLMHHVTLYAIKICLDTYEINHSMNATLNRWIRRYVLALIRWIIHVLTLIDAVCCSVLQCVAVCYLK